MLKTENFEKFEIKSAAELRKWLEKHHAQENSVWLVTFKKHTGSNYVSVSEVLDELICFGWIDGIRRKLDNDRTMQLISPRKAQHWSKSYKDRVRRLTKAKRMRKPGLARVAESKRNGMWTFMDDVDALTIPSDFKSELSGQKNAVKNFAASADSYKRNVLRWIKLAKTEKTRAKRIATAALAASKNELMAQF